MVIVNLVKWTVKIDHHCGLETLLTIAAKRVFKWTYNAWY